MENIARGIVFDEVHQKMDLFFAEDGTDLKSANVSTSSDRITFITNQPESLSPIVEWVLCPPVCLKPFSAQKEAKLATRVMFIRETIVDGCYQFSDINVAGALKILKGHKSGYQKFIK